MTIAKKVEEFRKEFGSSNGGTMPVGTETEDKIAQFLETSLREHGESEFKRGGEEPHETEDGYCCACGYDVAGFESDKKKQRDYDKSANEEALSSLVSALHEQFVFFPLATEEQWNEDIAPKLRDLHLAISGYKKGTPTARQYKYRDRSVWPENLKS